jgi:hypothetical protein
MNDAERWNLAKKWTDTFVVPELDHERSESIPFNEQPSNWDNEARPEREPTLCRTPASVAGNAGSPCPPDQSMRLSQTVTSRLEMPQKSEG